MLTAIRELDRFASQMGQFITNAVTGEFKKLYKSYVKDYVQLTKALAAAQPQFLQLAQDAGLHLLAGNFQMAHARATALRDHPALRGIVTQAKTKGFGSLVLYADAGASTNNLAAGGGVGIAISLTSGTTKIFGAASGALTTASTPSAGMGINIGFMRGSPSNIKGETIDVIGSGECDEKHSLNCTIALSWTAPRASMKVPFVKGSLKPAVFLFGLGTGVGGDPVSASLGATKAWVLQTIR